MGARTIGRAGSRNRKRRKSWTEQQSVFIYRLTQFLVELLFRYWGGGFRAVGVANIPATGGAFLIANHTSGVDPFVLGYPIKHRLLRGPGKTEIFESRFFSYFMRRLGMFPLRQGVADTAAVRTMVELYRHGRVVAIYPEGGRSESGDLTPFSPDFARLAIKLRARLVPAAIAGARDFVPIGTYRPRRHAPIAVVFGEPFDLSQYYDQTLTPETLECAAALMQSKVAELLPAARAERAKLLKRS